ncbi:hypothetical protein VTN31DRAFT_991 [Thermomyces dupontii]|uniref:uncharacterized protein n=1 Tax=Talaromyces thermophilus TaxID=28565 RepID=UPI0037425954
MSPEPSGSATKKAPSHRRRGPRQRVSRACLHCRQRKSRCDLDGSGHPGTPPCQRCRRDGRECILGSSNRGGRRVRKSKVENIAANGTKPAKQQSPRNEAPPSDVRLESNSFSIPQPQQYNNTDIYADANGHPVNSEPVNDNDDSASTAESAINSGVPRNPSDAWQCLTDIAKRGTDNPEKRSHAGNPYAPVAGSIAAAHGMGTATASANGGIRSYKLVQNGSLDPEIVSQLIARYERNFHPYLPLVPRKYFDSANLDHFASAEKHLLTAVLTIASKDLVVSPHIHEYCSKYMHELISGIAAGADCDVEAVEALLLLAEWEPQGLCRRVDSVGRGEEDRAAWMHVGLALRSGYFLGLDRTSFRGDQAGDAENDARRRLAWICCYISDRLVSVRIGRAFWSRGPGPMTGFMSQDFPSLQPVNDGDEDYAKIILATLDLTQLYGNVHDILYSGMRTSNQMMLMGDYIKYADDFRAAISRWNREWGALACSPPLKAALQMSYEYLRLYTNAFAFQAAISQAMARRPTTGAHAQREHLRAVFSNVASMSDARFIYESVDAAKAYLTILVNYVDPEQHLRFMPLRYYLYSIYAAVFLYKARSFGVVTANEEAIVRELVTCTTERLKRASAGPNDTGARYARLLELLWKTKSVPTSARDTRTSKEYHPPSGLGSRLPDTPQMQFSPANDFSWLDLGAVGDYVSNDQMATGFVGLDTLSDGNMYTTAGSQVWQNSNWAGDMSSSLLF